jgi:hypothetical protein
VDLDYPGIDRSRAPDEPNEIRVGLMDVRSALDIIIDYDYTRDGFRIRRATIHKWSIDDEIQDEGLTEIAFIPAYTEHE